MLNPAYAMFGEVHYNQALVDYSMMDKHTRLKYAETYFEKAMNAASPEIRNKYLKEANNEYYILNQIDSKNIYYVVQMARIYDYENNNSYSKAYFFKALQLNATNPMTNFHFGDYYYRRNEWRRALYYYKIALDNGYKETFDICQKVAKIYEKLGNLQLANEYYVKAFLQDPNNETLPDKIIELEDSNYEETGYYRRNRKTDETKTNTD